MEAVALLVGFLFLLESSQDRQWIFFKILFTCAGFSPSGRPVHVPCMMDWYIVSLEGCPILLCSHRMSRAVFRSKEALFAT